MSGFAETAIIGVLVGLGGAAITALGAVFLAGAAIAAAGKGAIALGELCPAHARRQRKPD